MKVFRRGAKGSNGEEKYFIDGEEFLDWKERRFIHNFNNPNFGYNLVGDKDSEQIYLYANIVKSKKGFNIFSATTSSEKKKLYFLSYDNGIVSYFTCNLGKLIDEEAYEHNKEQRKKLFRNSYETRKKVLQSNKLKVYVKKIDILVRTTSLDKLESVQSTLEKKNIELYAFEIQIFLKYLLAEVNWEIYKRKYE